MEIRQCGTHGLSVSSLGLGTLTWGRDTDEDQACAMLKSFVDAGGTLVEVSPLHGSGRALSVLAEALRAVGRHRVTIALRGAMRFSQGANELSASRGDMLRCLDTTLAILETDFVDLWLATPSPTGIPLEETLSALEWAYSSGRAKSPRFLGLCAHVGTVRSTSSCRRRRRILAPILFSPTRPRAVQRIWVPRSFTACWRCPYWKISPYNTT